MSATTLSYTQMGMGEADAKLRNFPMQLWGKPYAILRNLYLQKTAVALDDISISATPHF